MKAVAIFCTYVFINLLSLCKLFLVTVVSLDLLRKKGTMTMKGVIKG